MTHLPDISKFASRQEALLKSIGQATSAVKQCEGSAFKAPLNKLSVANKLCSAIFSAVKAENKSNDADHSEQNAPVVESSGAEDTAYLGLIDYKSLPSESEVDILAASDKFDLEMEMGLAQGHQKFSQYIATRGQEFADPMTTTPLQRLKDWVHWLREFECAHCGLAASETGKGSFQFQVSSHKFPFSFNFPIMVNTSTSHA